MAKESRDYLEMSFRSIECFANDGKLSVAELEEIFEIALKDGVVDDNEKRVLNNIFNRLTPAELTEEMTAKIADIRVKYQID